MDDQLFQMITEQLSALNIKVDTLMEFRFWLGGIAIGASAVVSGIVGLIVHVVWK